MLHIDEPTRLCRGGKGLARAGGKSTCDIPHEFALLRDPVSGLALADLDELTQLCRGEASSTSLSRCSSRRLRRCSLAGGAISRWRLGASKACRLSLAQRDLTEVRVKGDGNCQYRAIAASLWGNEEDWRRVKQAAFGRLRTHSHEYSEFLPDNSVENYIVEAEYDGQWGDAVSLQAALEALNVSARLIDATAGTVREVCARSHPDLFIDLVYYDQLHYNATRRRIPEDLAPMSQQAAGAGRRNTVKKQHPVVMGNDDREPELDLSCPPLRESLNVMTINVDSLLRHSDLLFEINDDGSEVLPDVLAIQEHRIPPSKQVAWRQWFEERDYNIYWSSASVPRARVAETSSVLLAVRRPFRFIVDGSGYLDAQMKEGRVLAGQLCSHRGCMLARVVMVYAYTEPSRNVERTRVLWDAVRGAMLEWRPAPCILLGDLQEHWQDLAPLARCVEECGLIDLVAEYEGPSRQTTYGEVSVIDHVLVDPIMMQRATTAMTQVQRFPSHRALTCCFDVHDLLVNMDGAQYVFMPKEIPVNQRSSWPKTLSVTWKANDDAWSDACLRQDVTLMEQAWSLRWERYLTTMLEETGVKIVPQMLGRSEPCHTLAPPRHQAKPHLAQYSLEHRQCATSLGRVRARLKRPVVSTWQQLDMQRRGDLQLCRRLAQVHKLDIEAGIEAEWVRAAGFLQDRLDVLTAQHKTRVQSEWKSRLLQPKEAIKFIKHAPLRQLTSVTTEHRTCTDSQSIDEALIDYWKGIGQRKCSNVTDYVLEGWQTGSEVALKDLSVELIMSTAKGLKKGTASGAGGWRAKELAVLPSQCWDEFRQLLCCMEATATTPAKWHVTWVTHIPKVPSAHKISDLRPISVSPLCWRLYMRLRCHDLKAAFACTLWELQRC